MSTPLVTLFWSLHQNEYLKWKEGKLDDWKSEVVNMCNSAQPIVDQVSTHEQLQYLLLI